MQNRVKKSKKQDCSISQLPIEEQTPSVLIIQHDSKTIQNSASWSHREALMYEAGILYIDQRYIFGTDIQKDFHLWMCCLNLISKQLNKRV